MLQLSIFESFNDLVALGGGSIPTAKPVYSAPKHVTTLLRTVKEITRDKMKSQRLPDLFELKVDPMHGETDTKFYEHLCSKVKAKIIRPLLETVETLEDLACVRDLFANSPWTFEFELSAAPAACLQVLKAETTPSKRQHLPVQVTVTEHATGASLVFNGAVHGTHKASRRYAAVRSTGANISEVAMVLSELYVLNAMRELTSAHEERFETLLDTLTGSNPYWPEENKDLLDPEKQDAYEFVPMRKFLAYSPGAAHLRVYRLAGFDYFSLVAVYMTDSRRSCTSPRTYRTHSYVSLCYRMGANDFMGILAEAEEEHRAESDYASSFEDKKNIPDKVLKAMRKSVLLKRFGFVEYDELTDLQKIPQVEAEILGFLERFPDISLTGHSFRIRRLGKHKAAGLYFSGHNALCIDIHSPSSAVHECMHMVDYSQGKLSSSPQFYRILLKYQDLLTSAIGKLDKENPLARRWNGSTKYNKAYYLRPTEVFARTGEIYFSRLLGENSSIVPQVTGLEYPSDPELLNLIDDYFGKLCVQPTIAA